MTKLRIAFLDTKASTPNHYIYLSIAAALRRHPAVDEVVEVDYGNALALAKERGTNFFLAYDGQGLNTEIARRLRERCGFAALWVTDDPYELRYNLGSAHYFDRIFTSDRSVVEAYGEKGAFLPFGADPGRAMTPLREGDPKLRYDVFFAGVAWPNRVRMLRSLLRDLPELRFKIALVGNEHLPDFALPLERSAYDFRTSPADFARLANASRIVLALGRDFAASSIETSSSSSPPPRIFEAAMAGSAQIAAAHSMELDDFFEPGVEIATYDTYRHCVEAIRQLCRDESRRGAIAAAAQARTLRDHTFDRRIEELLRCCEPLVAHARGNAGAAHALPRKRPRVLMVAHNVLGRAPFGGIEIYVDRLRRWIARDYETYIFAYDPASKRNAFVVQDARGAFVDRVEFDGSWQPFTLTNPLQESYFADLLARLEIDLVHYQHFIGHPLSLPIIARAMGIPAVWTLLDFDAACDSFNFIDYDGRYCDIERRHDGVCDHCTQRRIGLPVGAQRIRRAVLRRAFAAVDRIIVGSESTRTLYARFYPMFEDRARVVALGLPMPEAAETPARDGPRRRTDGAATDLVVAVLGNVTHGKGAHVVLDAAAALEGEPVSFRLHGRVDADIRTRIDASQPENVKVCGEYAPADLAQVLAGADATLHASIWPETFCIALSEAWAHGRVPIVTDIGALGERVVDRCNGLKVRPNDVADLVRLVRELIADASVLRTLEAGIDPNVRPQPAEHVDDLTAIYRDVLVANPPATRGAGGAVDRTRLSLYDCDVALSDRALAITRRGHEARNIVAAQVTPFAREHDETGAFEAIAAQDEAAVEPRFHAHLDEIDGHAASTLETIVKQQSETLGVRGWRMDRNVPSILGQPRVLLVDSSGHAVYAAQARVERRPDIVEAYRSDGLVWSGFDCLAMLGAVSAGTYHIAVDDNGRRSEPWPVMVRVLARVDDHDAVRDLAPGAPLRGGVERIGTTPVGAPEDVVAVDTTLLVGGWSEPANEGRWIVLESSRDGERRYAEIPQSANGEPFEVEIDAERLDAGTYGLSVAASHGGQLRSTPTLAHVRFGMSA